MELTMIKLAVERLYNEVEKLKSKNERLELEVQELKTNQKVDQSPVLNKKEEDELMDTKQVLKYLGVCYNTLQSIINKGFIQPIRINQRRIRFSKKSLYAYIRGLQFKSVE